MIMSRDYQQDQIQRALNEAKKRSLEERFGGKFSSTGPELPPEVEAEWLENIEEFERQFEQAAQITVGRYIGDPVLRRFGDIPPCEVEAELDRLLEILVSNNIEVHFDASVPFGERYKFITEELLKEEMDDIRVDGMTQHFIFEEFHPNQKLDAELEAEMFLRELLAHDVEARLLSLSNQELRGPDGTPITPEAMLRHVEEFRGGFAVFMERNVGKAQCTVDGDGYATVRVPVSWEALRAESMEPVEVSGTAVLRMKKEDEQWCVVQATLPGF